jgi:hypothetical protein
MNKLIGAMLLLAAGMSALAGAVIVEGNLTVSSNIVSQAFRANNATVDVLVVSSRIVLPQKEAVIGMGDATVRSQDQERGQSGSRDDAEGNEAQKAERNRGVGSEAHGSSHAEWARWGDARYLRKEGGTDLAMKPGRMVAGNGLSLSNIADSAFGASQHGEVAAGARAKNAGKGSMQLLCLTNAQSAILTGEASIGMGACVVTNNQALVVGDGIASHGDRTVTAAGFYGSGAGLGQLNLEPYAGANLVWDPVSNKLHATAVSYGSGGGEQISSEELTNAVLSVCQDIGQRLENALSVEGGVMAGVLDMNGHPVVGLPVPAMDSGAATKEYLRQVLSHLPPQGDLSMGVFTNGAPAAFPLSF